MKTFENQAAQGDLLITKVDALPAEIKAMEAEDGQFILAHSETGHHHVIDCESADAYTTPDELRGYVEVKNPNGADIIHLRSFDTHEKVHLSPGIYDIRRQREYTPEGFRRAAD